MQLAHRVSLNGQELDELDNRIIIKGIEEAAGKETFSAVSYGGRDGQRVTNHRRDTLDVTVKFALNIRRDQLQERSNIFELVNKWAANGGWLKVNYKAGRHVYVVCAQAPGAGDQWKRTNEYSITFRAFGVPYWQQEVESALRIQNISSLSNRAIGVDGSTQTVMNVEFRNTSGSTANTFSITASGKTFAFSDLGLANGETLVIDHTAEGVLRIRIKSSGGSYRSAFNKRTPESADELFISPGTIYVSMSSQRAGTLTVSYAGRFI